MDDMLTRKARRSRRIRIWACIAAVVVLCDAVVLLGELLTPTSLALPPNLVRPELAPYLSRLPTRAWRRRFAEGDHCFTQEALNASDRRLAAFLAEASAAYGDREALRDVFRGAVTDFDELNRKYDGYIETMEREELAEFFNAVADAAGLEHEDGDVTWEWRTNW